MATLWRGIQGNSLQSAMRSFFPVGAYMQVKAIANPGADYVNRLVREFRLDLAAAHALVGSDARQLTVDVPGANAHWVAPGACYNRVGYYEVPESRIVYRQRGQIRSLGIASMISWRGVWYVVHLGAVSRSGDRGVVDHPSLGTGASPAVSTC
jgi:hypothetical protein